MSNPNPTVVDLFDTIEHLSPEDFHLLNQHLDQKRQNRLKAIVQKARKNAEHASETEVNRILQEAIAEVRAENAIYGRS